MWIIGGEEVKEKGFQCSHGNVFSKILHSGSTPDQVSGTWWRLGDNGFEEDDGIRICRDMIRPAALRLISPNGHQRVAGEYLITEVRANGQPVWRLRGAKTWLYSGSNGSWIIGGSDAKEKNFNCARGVVYSKLPHGGLLPDRVGSLWLRLQDDKFVEDVAISITVKPPPLYVQSPNGMGALVAGEYMPVDNKLVNGQPLWAHIS